MTYPMHFFKGYPTLRVCPVCGVSLRLHHFRRWASTPAGDKRILHDACNACDPERKLSEMTPAQRLRAVEADHPRARLLVVENMNDAQHDAFKERKRSETLARHAQERRRAWRDAVGARVSAEREWARRTLESMRLAAKGDARPPSGALATLATALERQRLTREYAVAWVEFFTAYVQVLDKMHDTIHALSRQKYAPVKPTPQQATPLHYTTPTTVASLRRLFGDCRPLPDRRLMRDPWCLSWGQGE
jgi:hypothetical protein